MTVTPKKKPKFKIPKSFDLIYNVKVEYEECDYDDESICMKFSQPIHQITLPKYILRKLADD